MPNIVKSVTSMGQLSQSGGNQNWMLTDNPPPQAYLAGGGQLTYTVATIHTRSYGFTIPSAAVINGIQVRLRGLADRVYQSYVSIQGGGTKNFDLPNNSYVWTYYTLGGSTDTWGKSWTPSEINSTNFGLNISPRTTTNQWGWGFREFEITVYYTVNDVLSIQSITVGPKLDTIGSLIPPTPPTVQGAYYGGWGGAIYAATPYGQGPSIGKYDTELEIENLVSATILTSVPIVQNYTLDIENLTTATQLSTVNLSLQYILSIANLSTPTFLDGVAISSEGMAVASNLFTPTHLDTVNLVQHYVLDIANLATATELSNSNVYQNSTLSISPLITATQLSTPTLTIDYILAIQNLLSSTQLSDVSLTQHYQLAIENLTTGTQLDDIVFAAVLTISPLIITPELSEISWPIDPYLPNTPSQGEYGEISVPIGVIIPQNGSYGEIGIAQDPDSGVYLPKYIEQGKL